MCIVQHLADLENGCLAEISTIMQKKINGGGRPGPWPMDGVSVGVEPDEFVQEEDFMPVYHHMLHHGKSLVMAGIAGEGTKTSAPYPLCRTHAVSLRSPPLPLVWAGHAYALHMHSS